MERRSRPGRGLATLALLFAGVLVSGLTILQGIQPNDEGLMLAAARRIADGQWPYADFWWFYPPGQSAVLGALWSLLGPSLLTWRIVRVALDAVVAVLAWKLAGRRAGPRVALLAWAVALLAMAYPSGPHPFPAALALALAALLVFERRPLLAGVLAGACGWFRIEFAVFLGIGVLVAYALAPLAREQRVGAALRFAGSALATTVVLFLPWVIAAGPGDAYELLIRYPVFDFGDYQRLPFPVAYHGPLNTTSVGGFFSDSAESLLLHFLPLVLVAGLAGSLTALAVRFRRDTDWQLAATAVFGLGMLSYLLVRTDVFHTAPLAVVEAVLGAWAIGARTQPLPRPRLRPAALAGAGLAVAALAYAAIEGADRSWLAAREDTSRIHLGVADGARTRPALARGLEAVTRDIRRTVPPGRPIYVTGRRADIVTSGIPLLYVLADRPNPTRYDIQAPGVVTTAKVQREIVRDLERRRTPLVVRWDSPVTAAPEPNAAGRSSGVRLLDAYLARRYRPAERIGEFVLLRRAGP